MMNKVFVKRIQNVTPLYPFEAYAHLISPLPAKDGGGFLVTFPDLPGCMSDGETEAEAIDNVRDAFQAWVSARLDAGKPIPEPKFRPENAEAPKVSGKFVTRIPKSVHSQLANRAKAEGISLNMLVLSFIAEGLGRREHA